MRAGTPAFPGIQLIRAFKQQANANRDTDMIHRTNLYLTFAIVALLSGCGDPVAKAPPLNVQVPDQLILYSIDGNYDGEAGAERGDMFHGWPVLGKVEVNEAADRQLIMTAFEPDEREDVKDCFWPRHGVRAIQDGKTTDYLICFECNWVHVFNGEVEVQRTIADKLVPTFNQLLTDANIELSPVK